MKVAVLGSSGGMGGLFARYFLSKGALVAGFDKRKRRIKSPGFRLAGSNLDAVSGAEFIVVATPIDKTVETVKEISNALAPGACVIEIASVKGRMLGDLKRLVAAHGGKLLSLHPLFGPSLRADGEMKLCVIRTDSGALGRARLLFPEATLIPMNVRDHDRKMGIILSLTHLLNIAYAGVVSRYLTPDEFRRIQTPTSAVQLTLAEGVLSQSPSLYSYIQLENEFSSEFAEALIEEIASLRGLLGSRDRKGFEDRFGALSRHYGGDSKAALDLVYQAFEKSSR